MKVIFAGGSTGGHLMTGMSLAQEIKTIYPASEIVFFATSKPFEKQSILENGFVYKRLRYTTGKKKTILQKLRFLTGILIDSIYSGFVINRFKPDMIVGVGGYSSAPPVIAATILRSHFVLIEQNLVPGRMNRLFSRWAQEVYCHFIQSIEWFGNAKSVVATGNPIRKEILDVKKEVSARHLGLSLDRKTLLIMGGSQGAKVINDTIVHCLSELEKLSGSLQVVHCTGNYDFEEVEKVYKRHGIDAHVCPFLNNVEFAYKLADVIVSRAGAGTITEITAIGLPAILIPYPFAADNHQYFNALEMKKQGAAYLIEQKDVTVSSLIKLIKELLTDEKKHKEMKMNSKRVGKPEAAKSIFERIENLAIKKKIHVKSAAGKLIYLHCQKKGV